MRVNLKLLHKLLVVVAIPLVVQLGFLFSLLHNLHQAELSASREHRARQALASLNSIYERVTECSRSVGAAVLSKHGTGPAALDFHKMTATVPEDLSNLKEQLAGDSDAIKAADRLEETLNASLRILDEVFAQIESGNRIPAIQHLRDLRGAIPDLINQLNDLRQRCMTVADMNFDEDRRSRSRLGTIILLAVGINILMAIAFVIYINRNITSRLAILVENTHRLARQKPLLPMLTGGDEISHLGKVFKDMAEALELASKKERAIIETMPAGLAITDVSGRIQMANPTLLQLLHFGDAVPYGHPLTTLFAWEDHAAEDAQFTQLVADASGRTCERIAKRQSGGTFPVEVSITSFSMLEDKYYLLVLLDITERKEMERLKQEFVSMVSHDLRTPLTSIQVFLNMLAGGMLGPVGDKIQKKADMADRNASRLITLINDLLDIDKMEAGRLELNCADVDMESVINRALESVRPFGDQHGITLTQEMSGSDAIVKADGDRLVQVMVNLLGNAIKFSTPQSVVAVSVEHSEAWVTVQVTDQGRGVPPHMRTAIFERFKQVDVKDSTEKKGTGLGLAICKTIIEQHGGTIGVESESGKGSTFWFKLPLVSCTASCQTTNG